MPQHATKTSFSKANPRPGPGRKKLTPEERARNYDFKAKCREQLPIAMDLLAKISAEFGKRSAKNIPAHEVRAIAEFYRDSVHGRPAQAITGPDGGPLVGTFTAMVAQIDGAKAEKLAGPAIAAAAAQVTSNGGNGHGSGNGAHEKL